MSELIEDKYRKWEMLCEERFRRLKENEEKLNRFYIDLYDISEEITPDVDDSDVTVRRADLKRDIKSLLSYAIGCIFGRYSLDREGLCYAGGKWDSSAYKTIIPCKDNIMPIDTPESGLTAAVVDFVEKVYGSDTLEENLRFIADALECSGDSRTAIHNYLKRSFFDDHTKVYKKRPIYWQITSGRKGAFIALIYLHRFNGKTLSVLKDSYAVPRYNELKAQLTALSEKHRQADGAEKAALRRSSSRMQTLIVEMEGFIACLDQLIKENITIDLDDGVKVNYEKLKDILE